MNPLIVVTGFGPFEGHEEVNASWEAVRLLPNSIKSCQNIEYDIEKQEIPVEYDAVNEAVEKIWARRPALVIHCGVHGKTKSILVENLAYNHKFNRKDYSGKRLRGGSACLANNGTECSIICTKLNVKEIIDNTIPLCCNFENPIAPSDNVGNFLCGYIYLKSLDENSRRCLFIHVPPIDKPFSSAETSDMIFKIINECVRQIEKYEEIKECEECGCECSEEIEISNSIEQ